MSTVLALIPARAGSKGIPGKNFRDLCGRSPLQRAWDCVLEAGCSPRDIVITTDAASPHVNDDRAIEAYAWRPPELAQDNTPMIDVVKHALDITPGPGDQIILLIQPTQPLREARHVCAAVELLQTSGADSVVSVVDIGVRDAILYIQDSQLHPLIEYYSEVCVSFTVPPARQHQPRAYKADGTCYAFRRATVTRYGTIYGWTVCPLIIPPEETCPLDTPFDWEEAERRLRARG